MTVQMEFLKSLPHFRNLESSGLAAIKGLIFEKSYDRNEMIFYESERSDSLYFVLSGAVKAFKTSPDGKEQILYINRPGDSLNDIPALDQGPNPVSAQAMGPVTVCGIQTSDLKNILRKYPQIPFNFIDVISQRARHLVSLIEDLSFKHVIGRVAKILLEYVKDESGSRPRLTQQDMAAMAGTAREVIGRSLKSLEDEGLIRLERQRVILTDEKALRILAGVGI